MNEFNGLKFEDFDRYIRECKSICEMIDDVHRVIDKHAREFDDIAEFYLPTQLNTVIELLSLIMHDEYEWISYYCFEINFGNYEKEDMITANDGTPIPLHTTRQLWDMLLEDAHMTEVENDAN